LLFDLRLVLLEMTLSGGSFTGVGVCSDISESVLEMMVVVVVVG
jgi:hypothetical protein